MTAALYLIMSVPLGHLSRYLDRIEHGETILLCRRDKPIAEIRPIRAVRQEPRPIGLAKGQFSIPPEFCRNRISRHLWIQDTSDTLPTKPAAPAPLPRSTTLASSS